MMNPEVSTDGQNAPVEESAHSELSNSGELRLSVIMVLHNSEDALLNSAPILAKQLCCLKDTIPSETIFVDNASDDAASECVRSNFPQGRVIQLTENIGFGAGCNVGAKEARGDLLFFLNPDVILDSGAIEELVNVLTNSENAWAVTGRMRNPDGSFQPTCRELPNQTNIFGSRGSLLNTFLRQKTNKKNTEAPSYTLPDYPVVTEVPATAATALLIRRDTFAKLGGFDERFFMFMEDTDISAEIQARGGKIYFCPKAGALHYWGAGSRASSSKRSAWHHISVWRYYRKRLPGFFSMIVLPLALLVNFFASALLRAFHKP